MSISRLLLIASVLLLTGCTQEVSQDGNLPAVTSVLPTPTSLLTTPVPATPTLFVFSLPQALASGPLNIITLGDDLTLGVGDNVNRGYPGNLIEIVNQIRPGSSTINLAQNGWTSDDLVYGDGEISSQLDHAVMEIQTAALQGRGTIVLVWIGGNDLWELYTGTEEVTIEKENDDVLRFSMNIEMIITRLREAGAEVILAKLDDQSQRPAQTRSKTYPDITAAELLRMSAQVRRYNAAITENAEKYHVLTVDFYDSKIFTQSDTLYYDGMHPNATGYKLIAQAWYKLLIKILP